MVHGPYNIKSIISYNPNLVDTYWFISMA
jgi:hypothetical protein